MIVYTGMMIRMRPGQMFKLKPKSKNKITLDSTKKTKPFQKKSFVISDERKVFLNKFTGLISVKRKGDYLKVEAGMVLGFKDQLVTGPRSVAILKFANNSTLKVFSNSQFNITKIQSRERSDINKQYNIFELKKGALLVDFINQGDGHILEITSPSSKLQVRGTQFLYLHNESRNRSQVAVREGVVKAFKRGTNKSKFVLEQQGLLVSENLPLGEVAKDKWVEKINWKKLSLGSGIDLFNPRGSKEEKIEWKKRRKRSKDFSLSQITENTGKAASNTKAGGLVKSVLGKVLEVGGAIAEKGVNTLKRANPVSKVNEVGEEMRNFEDQQKSRIDLIDSMDEN